MCGFQACNIGCAKLKQQGTAARKVGGGHRRKPTAVDDLYIVLQSKRTRTSQQAPLLGNCVQPHGDKCHGVL
ncbi:hypothetical protein TNCV_54881 [Trichonephila clavipes]|nr:hypothetical protein TNCV_54881 [Trichonephila clavipes]